MSYIQYMLHTSATIPWHTVLAKHQMSCTSRANCLADSSWAGESSSSSKSSAWDSRTCRAFAPWGCSPPTCRVSVSVSVLSLKSVLSQWERVSTQKVCTSFIIVIIIIIIIVVSAIVVITLIIAKKNLPNVNAPVSLLHTIPHPHVFFSPCTFPSMHGNDRSQ